MILTGGQGYESLRVGEAAPSDRDVFAKNEWSWNAGFNLVAAVVTLVSTLKRTRNQLARGYQPSVQI